jgi:2-oxo-4-hydroxy-4-carboxy-5-ureidoimidazoline decarboxylase
VTLEQLNALPADEAERTLKACGGSSRWVTALLARRPFASREELLSSADAAWRELAPNDWREAIAGHPRIGERASTYADERSKAWSAEEQSGAAATDAWLRVELARANSEYEARFGHTFIVYASGKAAEEILNICRARMANSAEKELVVIGEELRKIARARLEKLLGATEGARS